LHLLSVNDLIVPTTYKTGLFYFIFSAIISEDGQSSFLLPDAIAVLRMLHTKQTVREYTWLKIILLTMFCSFWQKSLACRMNLITRTVS